MQSTSSCLLSSEHSYSLQTFPTPNCPQFRPHLIQTTLLQVAALPAVSIFVSSFSKSPAPPASVPVNNCAFCFIPGIVSNSFLRARLINQLLWSCLPPPGTLCMSFVNDSSQAGLTAKTPLFFAAPSASLAHQDEPNTQTAQFFPASLPSPSSHHRAQDCSLLKVLFPPLLLCQTKAMRTEAQVGPLAQVSFENSKNIRMDSRTSTTLKNFQQTNVAPVPGREQTSGMPNSHLFPLHQGLGGAKLISKDI